MKYIFFLFLGLLPLLELKADSVEMPDSVALKYDSLLFRSTTEKTPALYTALGKITVPYNTDTAIFFFRKALNLSVVKSIDRGEILCLLAAQHRKKGEFDQGILLFSEAQEIFQNEQNEYGNALCLMGMANIYLRSGMASLQTTEGYLRDAAEVFQKLGKSVKYCSATMSLAGCLLQQKKDKEAEKYFKEIQHYAREIGVETYEAQALYSLGLLEEQRGSFTEALKLYRSSYEIDKRNGLQDGFVRLGIAITLDKLGRTDEAIIEIEAYLSDLQSSGADTKLYSALITAAELYEKKGELNKALKLQKQCVLYLDSTYSAEKVRFSQELEQQFELRHQKQKNKILEQEKTLADAEAKRNFLLSLFAAVGMLITVVFGLYFYRNARQRHRHNEVLQKKNSLISEQKSVLEEQAEELKQNNDVLRKLDNFKQRMTAMIVHDFKNALNLIMSASHENSVKSAAMRLLSMTHNILDTQRLEEAELSVNKTVFSVPELFRQAVSRLLFLAEQKNVHLQNEASELHLFADKELCLRILENLLSNALRFVPENGIINLSAEDLGDRVQILVEDNGTGIPEEEWETVFEPYVRGEAQSTNISTGLGLAFCKTAAEAQGGSISAGKSQTLGGAAFILLLPKAKNSFDTLDEDKAEFQFNFTEEEKTDLLGLANALRDMKIFMFSEILEEADKYLNLQGSEQQRWRKALENALIQEDELAFEKLKAALYS